MPDPRGHDKISFSMTKRQIFKTWNKMTPDEAIQFFLQMNKLFPIKNGIVIIFVFVFSF